MNGAEILIPILVPLSFFAMVFGLVYIKSRENMSMIEKGLNPKNLLIVRLLTAISKTVCFFSVLVLDSH
jgi:hypothetical protein